MKASTPMTGSFYEDKILLVRNLDVNVDRLQEKFANGTVPKGFGDPKRRCSKTESRLEFYKISGRIFEVSLIYLHIAYIMRPFDRYGLILIIR